MHKPLQKLGALALAGAMTLTLFSGTAPAALAAGETTPADQRTVDFKFDPHEGGPGIGDLSDSCIYSDSYFSKDSSEVNEHLATMSMQLAAASISSESYDRDTDAYTTRSKNVVDLLEKIGFEKANISVNDYYKEKMGEDTMGVAVAYKPLDENTVLLAIVPRSAGYESEWSGNFNVGTGADNGGLHEGFKTARDIALKFAKEYVTSEQHKAAFANKTVKVWTVGYSRGAATANLIGAAIADGAKNAIGVNVESTNIFAYTFGTPATVQTEKGEKPSDPKYNGIHNYYSDYDPVAMMPFSTWGFTRYGEDHTLNNNQKDRMLNFLQELNPTVHYIYTQKGGDPDNFTAMQFNPQTMAIQPDTSKTISQKDFFAERIAYLTKYRVQDRATYVSGNYESMLRTLMVLNFGGDGNDMARLAGALQSNDYRDEATGAAEMVFAYSLMQACAEQYDETQLPDYNELEGLMEQFPALKEALKQKLGVQYDSQLLLMLCFSSYQELAAKTRTMAVDSVQALLERVCKETLNLSTNGLEDRLMSKETFAAPLVEFLSAFAFGVKLNETERQSNSIAYLAQKQANTAATLYANSGSYMRVHNNEVILSWLRTQDTNYAERYTVTVNGKEIGKYKAGQTVTIDGTPDERFRTAFKSWATTDVTLDNDNSMVTTFTMPEKSVALTANYVSRIRNTTLTVAKPVAGSDLPTTGTLSWDGGKRENITVSWLEEVSKGKTQPASGEAKPNTTYFVKAYVKPDSATLFAFDIDENSENVCYTGETSQKPTLAFVDGGGSLYITGPAVKTEGETPAPATETCKVTITGKETGTSWTNQWEYTYNKGETVTITAPVVKDKEFTQWEGDAVSDSNKTNPTLTLSNLTSNVTLTAVYTPVLTELNLQMPVPMLGQKLAVAEESTATTKWIESIEWTPKTNGLPAWGTTYTAKVTLNPTSVANYILSDKMQLTINGKSSGITARVAQERGKYVIYIQFSQAEAPVEQVKTPKASLPSATYRGGRTIYLTCETKDATIYYTLDGTTPTTGSPHCTSGEAITLPNVTAEIKLQMLAVKDGMTDSAIPLYTYTIQRQSSGSSKPVQKPEDKPAEEPKQDYKTCKHDSTCPLAKFTDLDANAWYHDGVHDCLDKGLMAGYGDGTFGPNDSISRAQVVTVLWRMAKSPAPTAANAFTDVPADTWYTDAVRWAAENGVVGGYGDGRFGPNDPVTREQLAAMFYRFAKQQGRDVSQSADIGGYADAASVSGWATGSLQWACGAGILNGMDGSLVPQGTATRAQTAAMLQRLAAAAE